MKFKSEIAQIIDPEKQEGIVWDLESKKFPFSNNIKSNILKLQ